MTRDEARAEKRFCEYAMGWGIENVMFRMTRQSLGRGLVGDGADASPFEMDEAGELLQFCEDWRKISVSVIRGPADFEVEAISLFRDEVGKGERLDFEAAGFEAAA